MLQLAAVLKRGLLQRSFQAWQQLAVERQWKVQLGAREREVALLEGKVRGYEKRPLQVGLELGAPAFPAAQTSVGAAVTVCAVRV